MILLDSNIIIYAAQPAYRELRKWLEKQVFAISELSRLEVMGYHRIEEDKREYFHQFFNVSRILPISEEVIETAIPIRRTYNMSLGDAVIAATAIHYGCKLCTNNQKDFKKVDKLRLVNISEFV
ncbi:MAG: type II toxin-antitoxin system VapC family toxin [Gracilimonas sp.]|uniref:type II toxin-antitoxin system VapC family toxin n=1 Tax=Gracilimonas sp. TaxID=1974203 RepID=UPI0037529196|nr:type II toxin-antitoxin system VapC family toxin [Gracilimonas sp.]